MTACVTPLVVSNANRTKSLSMPSSKIIHSTLFLFQMLMRPRFQPENTVCCNALRTMAVFPQTLAHFLNQMGILRVSCCLQTSTMHRRSSKRIILSIITALWSVIANSAFSVRLYSPRLCCQLKVFCLYLTPVS